MEGDKLEHERIPISLPHYFISENKLKSYWDEMDVSNQEIEIWSNCNGEKNILQIAEHTGYDIKDCMACIERFEESGHVTFVLPRGKKNDTGRNLRVGVFSPHPDDAVLACGGMLSEWILQNEEANISIINLFSNENYSIKRELQKDLQVAKEVIEKEELTIGKMLGAGTINLDYYDAPLRGYESVKNIFFLKEIKIQNEQDIQLVQEIKQDILNCIEENQFDVIFIPIGIGGHLDHILTRIAVSEVVDASFPEKRVFFYEDQPYVSMSVTKEDTKLKFLEGMSCRKVPITAGVEWKQRLLQVYKSQLTNNQIKKVIQYSWGIQENLTPLECIWERERTYE